MSLDHGHQEFDVQAHAHILELVASPLWIYDCTIKRNLWGNSAAMELFGCREQEVFCVSQFDDRGVWAPEDVLTWTELNNNIQTEVQDGKKEIKLIVKSDRPAPGLLALAKGNIVVKALFKPLAITVLGVERVVSLVQIVEQHSADAEDNHLRMVEMCDNHPMFQFLFDINGNLLAANKRAMVNMTEHLGACRRYTLKSYLSMGESDGEVSTDDMYHEAMKVIFEEKKPCHRFPQLRASKRIPGKYRWVLYEMWPLTDPITQQPCALVCEQNITQVKSLEEQFRKQNQRLEEQLEEALAQRDMRHKSAIDIDTPADKTLKLLDKIMRGHEVAAKEAMELHDAIVRSGDLRQPVNFNEQVLEQSQSCLMDQEVGHSLIQLLSSRKTAVQERCEGDDGPTSSSGNHHVPSGEQVPDAQDIIQFTRNMPDDVMTMLFEVDSWQFDAFKLMDVTGGRPLSVLAHHLFKRYDLIDKFQLDEMRLVQFLLRIEEGYPSNPYHNRMHAADVLQSLHVLLCQGGLRQGNICDDLSMLSCYLAAIIHDYQHKGVNNDFLVRTGDNLAILYNDRSPMENHHLAATFQLLNSDQYNFLPKIQHKAMEAIRKQVIEMVLATDMKQHFAIHSMFQAKMQSLMGSSSTSAAAVASSRGSPQNSSPLLRVLDDDIRNLVLQLALKCADLGHLSSPRRVHKKWVHALEEELFRQGDCEKLSGLQVSPLMDREKHGITKSQVGFFDIVALPLFQSFAQTFVEASPMLEAVRNNYNMWREEAAMGPAPSLSQQQAARMMRPSK
ncbi:hypothetical protein CEUSTIGMA_g2690.t1 [Chlamydomonas eustigma]|uniref:Phosphodiesterase n=1 Tax=Chlamydomonas eustigma TaxID=1157962 RepID=A0A250WWS5_9CHLO|nr:hypothetical protein CEUSTIGMA_g2690.t1 [Chlamydomonas eustigma]|eukprot:GAX75245.1 hypothetical protein CEUSTIGMA_g2690.t1 [Chlamydomonas eustigma]